MDFRGLILILCNLLSFCLFGYDKRAAKTDAWRIPEKTLWLFALLFGAAGALAGMYVFHHKTKKPVFRIGMPVLVFIETALIVYLIYRGGIS